MCVFQSHTSNLFAYGPLQDALSGWVILQYYYIPILHKTETIRHASTCIIYPYSVIPNNYAHGSQIMFLWSCRGRLTHIIQGYFIGTSLLKHKFIGVTVKQPYYMWVNGPPESIRYDIVYTNTKPDTSCACCLGYNVYLVHYGTFLSLWQKRHGNYSRLTSPLCEESPGHSVVYIHKESMMRRFGVSFVVSLSKLLKSRRYVCNFRCHEAHVTSL